MGSAIANALITGNHDVTVWNRSPNRMLPFEPTAASCATNAAEAITASQVIVVCIDDYAATRELLESSDLAGLMKGRTLVQLSAGTPQEARDQEEWAFKQEAKYLAGAIMAYPREIGHDGMIFTSGSQATFESTESLLSALSSNVRFLGTAVGAAAGMNLAMMSYYVCTHLGLIQGALVCEAEGIRPDLLASLIVESMPSDTEEIQHLGKVLQSGKFDNPGASIGVYSGGMDSMLEQARDASINTEIAEFVDGLYKRGMAAGLEQEEVVALIKILRK